MQAVWQSVFVLLVLVVLTGYAFLFERFTLSLYTTECIKISASNNFWCAVDAGVTNGLALIEVCFA